MLQKSVMKLIHKQQERRRETNNGYNYYYNYYNLNFDSGLWVLDRW